MYLRESASNCFIIIFTVLVIPFVIGINTWLKKKARMKIESEIRSRGARLISIDEVSRREMIYSVKFEVDGDVKTQTVKYSVVEGLIWY